MVPVQPGQQAVKVLPALQVHAGGGLVQQHDLRAGDQSPGQQHPLALPAGQGSNQPAPIAGHSHQFQGLPHPLPVLLPREAEQADLPGQVGQNDLLHGGGKICMAGQPVLGHITQPSPISKPGRILAQQPHGAAAGGELPQQQF